MPGVGRTPTEWTSPPAESAPETRAPSSMGPDNRVSLPTTSRSFVTPWCSRRGALGAETERQLGGEGLGVGDGPDAIGAEEAGHVRLPSGTPSSREDPEGR